MENIFVDGEILSLQDLRREYIQRVRFEVNEEIKKTIDDEYDRMLKLIIYVFKNDIKTLYIPNDRDYKNEQFKSIVKDLYAYRKNVDLELIGIYLFVKVDAKDWSLKKRLQKNGFSWCSKKCRFMWPSKDDINISTGETLEELRLRLGSHPFY